MNERLKMKPFVLYTDRARFYRLLSLRLEMNGNESGIKLGSPLNADFTTTVRQIASAMVETLSSTEKAASFVETMKLLQQQQDARTLHELFLQVFSPLSPEEVMVFRALVPQSPMKTVTYAFSELGKLVSLI